ncbi:MAG: hypothetical protein E7015_04145 [Alphaproteobacteria bacterium]|nr:hypothetical protein [Alphaproteobacteria bacterium]
MDEIVDIQLLFSNMIRKDRIVLFLRGCSNFSVCGLSSTISYILKKSCVKYKGVDLLTSPNLHRFLRDKYHPLIAPYLFVDAKFIGGFEEILSLHNEGRLASLLSANLY